MNLYYIKELGNKLREGLISVDRSYSSYLSQCVIDGAYNGFIETKWQSLINRKQ